MAEYTLLKLQVEDASFTAHAPFSGAGGESDADEGSVGDVDSAGGDGDDADGAGADRSLLPVVVGLVFLVAVAVAVKKFRDDGDT